MQRHVRLRSVATVATLVLPIAFGIVALRSWLARHVEHWSSGPPVEESVSTADAFVRILDRTPTEAEMNAVKSRLRHDPTFSTAVLEHILALSPERTRRVATQTNALKTELDGLYTRQQVRLHVRGVYADVTGSEPSSEAERFLMQRYVASGMDEHALIRLTKAIAIVPIAGNPFGGAVPK